MAFLDFLFGSKAKDKKKSLLTEEQNAALKDYFANPLEKSDLYGAGSTYLQQLLSGSPEAYQAFEKPYIENFEQNIAPAIAQRYAGMGTGAGALSSSALNTSLAQAGRGLQTDLASLRSGLQMQALPQALQYAQQPMTNKLAGASQRTFENIQQPQSFGVLGNSLLGLSGGFSQGLGNQLSGFAAQKLGLPSQPGLPGQ